MWVLVSQGIEIFRTEDSKEAFDIMYKGNDEWYKYCIKCAENNEVPVDNEIFIYEE